jgi:hypothetical protein
MSDLRGRILDDVSRRYGTPTGETIVDVERSIRRLDLLLADADAVYDRHFGYRALDYDGGPRDERLARIARLRRWRRELRRLRPWFTWLRELDRDDERHGADSTGWVGKAASDGWRG